MPHHIFRGLFCALFSAVMASGAEWLPADRPSPALSPVLPRETLRVETPVGTFHPSEMIWSRSLDGEWKFSGLTSSAGPFAPPTAGEMRFASPGFDDSGWSTIRVPLNWYRDARYDYKKVLRAGSAINPASAGGSDGFNPQKPYFKGFYRREFDLPAPLPQGRLELQFDGIGYEAEIFLNGKHAGHHQGDFVPTKLDVTGLAVPGRNLLALRVLSDFRPPDEKFTRTYGAMWDPTCFKGGIWLPVRIVARGTPKIEELLLNPDCDGNLQLDYAIENTTTGSMTVIPGVTVADARNTADRTTREFPAVTLKPGMNRGTLSLRKEKAKLWSPGTPELYYATLYLRDSKKVLSAETERFGFREFKVNGTGFTLNGKPIYLYFESAHSVRFGGYDTADGNSIPVRTVLEGHLKKGYNMLRTAHMPVRREFLDAADELGMMIYDEWSCCFITGMHEKEFEKNNLPELERFLRAHYNHPSVVMWCLGNEVSHRNDPAIVRQLAKQSALTRRIDRQKRPLCAFAANGNVDSYGRSYIDTDVVDLHLYTGITDAWTRWDREFEHCYNQCAGIFGDGKRNTRPIIISECIGGGWGMPPDPSFRLGDVDRYLELIRRPFTWGTPGAAGYSGSIGVAAALDPRRGCRYLQNRLGVRIAELIRQDSRIAGFAPWLASPDMPNAAIWNQSVYPGLRYSRTNKLLPRQLRTPATYELEAFVLNQNGPALQAPRLRLELAADGKVTSLAAISLPPVAENNTVAQPFRFTLPETRSHAGELRLTLFDGDREVGRNGYDVTLQPDSASFAPAEAPEKIALLSDSPALEELLDKLRIPFSRIHTSGELAKFKRALLCGAPWGREHDGVLRDWVNKGGFLMMIEPAGTPLQGFQEYKTFEAPNTLIEPIIPAHPVFAGMDQDDFDTWAENAGGNVVQAVCPLTTGALAAKGAALMNNSLGAAVMEVKVDKGRLFVSTVQTLSAWRKNGAAARYLGNLLRYLAAERSLYPARALERPVGNRSRFRISADAYCIDLASFANRGFTDECADDGKGGWLDQGDNDFRNLPKGRQNAAGVPFEIIDPAGNNGKGCLILRGRQRPEFPKAIRGIPVGRKVASLYFLHAAAWVPFSKECGRYRIHYADGKSEELVMFSGRNVDDWWKPGDLPEALPAFVHTNNAGGKVGFFVTGWNNPRPDVAVKSVDFLSAASGDGPVPILAGLTAEPAPERPAVLFAGAGDAGRWHFGSEPEGAPAAGKVISSDTPAGKGRSVHLSFPANVDDRVPYAFLIYKPELLQKAPFRTLSFLLRSNTPGIIDVVVPQKNWRSTRSASINLETARTGWGRIRLDLTADFRLAGTEFDSADIRPELFFYNGKDREAGYPRREAEFEIADIRLEP